MESVTIKTYTTSMIAKICKVSAKTVCNWIDKGKLKGYRLPGSQDRRATHEDLAAFIQANGLPNFLADTDLIERLTQTARRQPRKRKAAKHK
jgi:excisionase family DNA binding protein